MKKLFLSTAITLLVLVGGCQTKADADSNKKQVTTNNKTEKSTSNKMTNVVIETTMGNITVELNEEKAPVTVANFLKYVNNGFYTNTIFHRVINGFMIQGGGMDANMQEKTTFSPIKLESNNGLKNDRGTIAMARTQVPDSATSQFFINLKNNDFLNFKEPTMQGYGYAVFGKVVSGMEVVDKIAVVKTGSKGYHDDVPVQAITIKNVTVVK